MLKLYTTLEVGYVMAGGGWVMVPWITILVQGREGQAKGAALLAGCREPRKKLSKLKRRKIGGFERQL